MSSELSKEYAEGYDALGHRGLVFYKFVSMVSVKIRDEEAVIKFGPNLSCTYINVPRAEELREYLKEQKEWIREQGDKASVREMTRRMWWLMQKMIDFGIWTIQDQKYIVYWYDTCTEQFTTA
jgi:hypothetical protein